MAQRLRCPCRTRLIRDHVRCLPSFHAGGCQAHPSTRLSLARLLWTYRFPFAWDGAVSCLGAYEPEEMLSLAREAVPAGYIWDAGRKAIPASPAKLCITYLIGEPQLQ